MSDIHGQPMFGSTPTKKKSKLVPILVIIGIIILGGLVAGTIAVYMVIVNGSSISGAKSDAYYAAELKKTQAAETAQIEAKKDFTKGETAQFGEFELTANSVELGFDPGSDITPAGDGKQYALVEISVKNTSDTTQYFSSYDLLINSAGATDAPYLLDIEPVFVGGDIASGETLTGNLVYIVPVDATDLKLQYTMAGNDSKNLDTVELTYTLGL